VKQAWDGYWAMIVRLASAPDPNDPELDRRTTEPLRSFLKDDFGTQATTGQRVVIPPGAKYAHQYLNASITGDKASVTGCQLDDSVTVGPSGEVVDDSVSTKGLVASFVLQNGTWLANEVRITDTRSGLVGCGSQ
jgi:hypothetical protein